MKRTLVSIILCHIAVILSGQAFGQAQEKAVQAADASATNVALSEVLAQAETATARLQLMKAEWAFDDAVRRFPKSSDAFLARGKFFLRDYPVYLKAKVDLERSLELSPESKEAEKLLGQVGVRIDEIQAKLTTWNGRLQANSRNLEAYSHLTTLYLQLGKPQEALSLCAKGAALDAKNFTLAMNKGTAELRLGKLEASLGTFEKAATLARSLSLPKQNIGAAQMGIIRSANTLARQRIEQARGFRARAVEALKQAQKLRPSDDYLKWASDELIAIPASRGQK